MIKFRCAFEFRGKAIICTCSGGTNNVLISRSLQISSGLIFRQGGNSFYVGGRRFPVRRAVRGGLKDGTGGKSVIGFL